jgi:hypothetical protein
LERVHDDLGLWPRKLIANTGYVSAEMLAWLIHERDIHPHIPVFDKSASNDGTFARADFTYDARRVPTPVATKASRFDSVGERGARPLRRPHNQVRRY